MVLRTRANVVVGVNIHGYELLLIHFARIAQLVRALV